jgi:hypothetical protein
MRIKTSNKILLAAGITPVLVIFITLLILRIMMSGDALKAIASSSEPGPQTTKTIDLDAFNKISVVGPWTVHIIQGSNYKVIINAPQNVIDKLIVKRGGANLFLFIDENQRVFSQINNTYLEATITLPFISELDINGVINLDLSEIKNDSLILNINGVTKITASSCTVQNLSLTEKGIANIDLSGVPIANANLECDGTFNIDLLMNGGRLSGNLNGVGNLSYKGEVSVNDIQVNSPMSKVVHRN